ncbi:MAG TPA: tRNA (adenosine(37)-N6)-threonylcarbamoyltransferase complex ATPase subunit type 1 TsaE [Nitrospiria bacterium]
MKRTKNRSIPLRATAARHRISTPPSQGNVIRHSRSPDETRRIGELIGRRVQGGDWIALEGNLGAGKTHFIQGLARGLDIEAPVTSPTFVYVHEFRGRCPFAHVDLYRIERAADLPGLGLEDYFESPWVTAVEWADKGGGHLPAERLTVRIARARGTRETHRRIEVTATGGRYQNILEALKKINRHSGTRPGKGKL